MTTIARRESAKVYQFPLRGSAVIGTKRLDGKPAIEPRAQTVASTSFGSGWYHEAAVQDSDRGLKP